MQQLTALSLRFVAAFLVLLNISTFATVLPMVVTAPEKSSLSFYPMIIGPGTMVIVGIVVLVFADRLSGLLCRQPSRDIEVIGLSSASLARVGTALLGLYLVVTSMPGFVIFATKPDFVIEASKSDYLRASHDARYFAGLISSICKAILGCVLLIFARYISRAILRE
ncbi:MAG: hypothetical protein AAFZ91_00720 [Pseudomonadota bacterium]